MGWVVDPERSAGVAVPFCSIERPRWPTREGDYDRAIGYVDAAIDELECSDAAPGTLALLHAQEGPLLWWARRQPRSARVGDALPGAGPVRTPDARTRRSPRRVQRSACVLLSGMTRHRP